MTHLLNILVILYNSTERFISFLGVFFGIAKKAHSKSAISPLRKNKEYLGKAIKIYNWITFASSQP